MAKITYDNKSNLNLNANVPNVNKVTDNDMNEIKSVVNSNFDEGKDDIFYKTNDTLELGSTDPNNDYILPAYISAGAKEIYALIVTPKRLNNINSIVVNNATLKGRGASGYLNNSGDYLDYVQDSAYNVSAQTSSDNTILIRIVKSTAFTNITNNTPLILDGYISFTFN